MKQVLHESEKELPTITTRLNHDGSEKTQTRLYTDYQMQLVGLDGASTVAHPTLDHDDDSSRETTAPELDTIQLNELGQVFNRVEGAIQNLQTKTEYGRLVKNFLRVTSKL